jgi:hypothetical protein
MADTGAQREASRWIMEEWLPEKLGTSFHSLPVKLKSGGDYRFDAVSEDGSIVAAISTSAAKTSSGKSAIGKLSKIRADMYFLLLSSAKRKLLLFTEQDMFERFIAEQEKGRVAEGIELSLVRLPAKLAEKVRASRARASGEVQPR